MSADSRRDVCHTERRPQQACLRVDGSAAHTIMGQRPENRRSVVIAGVGNLIDQHRVLLHRRHAAHLIDHLLTLGLR
ncbi:Uncharacterised protein [Mycobacteroides abscessus subsp. massiliense]|nr:Uncharacterised protein [Mycobacteroides abscessus subsp. massiliense]